MNFDSFFSDVCSGLLSGAALAALFFLFREWWHPLPSITGRWYLETHTTSSTYSQFADLRLKYEAMIWQAGPAVSGSMEKIFEHNSKEAFQFDNAKRTHATVEGYIDRFYLRKNRIILHLIEEGRVRDSSCIFVLVLKKGELVGTFHSTAADSSGTAVWSQQRNSVSFTEVVRNERAIPRAAPADSTP
jgi:hypothetical protein